MTLKLRNIRIKYSDQHEQIYHLSDTCWSRQRNKIRSAFQVVPLVLNAERRRYAGTNLTQIFKFDSELTIREFINVEYLSMP